MARCLYVGQKLINLITTIIISLCARLRARMRMEKVMETRSGCSGAVLAQTEVGADGRALALANFKMLLPGHGPLAFHFLGTLF